MITVIVYKKPENFDSDDIRFQVGHRLAGHGYIGKTSGKIGLIRCPECGRENYAPNVVSGICCFCGFNANQPSLKIVEEEADDY